MSDADDPLHEQISLAIAMWTMGLPVTITLEQRQALHDDIIKALRHVGLVTNRCENCGMITYNGNHCRHCAELLQPSL